MSSELIYPFLSPLRYGKGCKEYIYALATYIYMYFYGKHCPASPTMRAIRKCCD